MRYFAIKKTDESIERLTADIQHNLRFVHSGRIYGRRTRQIMIATARRHDMELDIALRNYAPMAYRIFRLIEKRPKLAGFLSPLTRKFVVLESRRAPASLGTEYVILWRGRTPIGKYIIYDTQKI